MDERGHRIHEVVEIPIGTVVHDVVGWAWVFVGTSRSKTGHPHHFVKVLDSHQLKRGHVWEATVDFWETLIRRFPDAAKLRLK